MNFLQCSSETRSLHSFFLFIHVLNYFKMKHTDSNIFLVLGSFQFLILHYNCSTVDEDLNLTYRQKLSLDKMKEAVADKLPLDYMKQDVYLIRWLRAHDFNPDQAEQKLIKNIKWREKNKLDTILNEDWSDMLEEYPYRMVSRDKEGKPVLFGDFGHWDLRRADLTGQFDRLTRYGLQIIEDMDAHVRELQSEGKMVTRTIVVFDMDGFNLAQHMCSKCLSFILDFCRSFDDYYPGLVDKLFIINNHPLVNSILPSLLNIFSPQTRRIIRVYGRNKDVYSKVFLELIESEQLPVKYGGTKVLE